MKDYKDIQLLVERFFQGETTMEEEKEIYAFYASYPQLPEDLESYREMFAAFDAISLESMAQERHHHHHRLLYVISGIAAAVLLCVGIFIAVDIHQDSVLASNYEGSYMIVNGERITDLSRIKPEIQKALNQAERIEHHVDEHSVIKNAEQNVLDHIDDPKEKARIQQLLNE